MLFFCRAFGGAVSGFLFPKGSCMGLSRKSVSAGTESPVFCFGGSGCLCITHTTHPILPRLSLVLIYENLRRYTKTYEIIRFYFPKSFNRFSSAFYTASSSCVSIYFSSFFSISFSSFFSSAFLLASSCRSYSSFNTLSLNFFVCSYRFIVGLLPFC